METPQMTLTPDQTETAKRIIASSSHDFVELAKLAGLRPALDFKYARLRDIDFGAVNLTGFNFSGADLTNSDLSKTILPGPVLTRAILADAKLPSTYDERKAKLTLKSLTSRPEKVQRRNKNREFPLGLRDQVHQLLQLAGGHIETDHIVAGEKIDLYMKQDFGVPASAIAVGVKDWASAPSWNDLTRIEMTLSSAFASQELAALWIVGSHPLSPVTLKRLGERRHVRYFTIETLMAALVDFDRFLGNWSDKYENSEAYSCFVPLRARASNVSGKDFELEPYLARWLSTPDASRLAIFGEPGSGKTSAAEHFTYVLAKQIIDGKPGRVPIYIKFKSHSSLSSLISSKLTENGHLRNYSYALFELLNFLGRFLIILDGIDDDCEDDGRNISRLLMELSNGASKVVLLGRPRPIADAKVSKALSESVNSLQESSPTTLDILELAEFDETQVQTFIAKYLSHLSGRLEIGHVDERRMRQRISDLYDGNDLVRRPLLARMLVELLASDLPDSRINKFALYDTFVTGLLRRHSVKRGLLIAESGMRDALQDAAWWLWTRKRANVALSELPRRLSAILKLDWLEAIGWAVEGPQTSGRNRRLRLNIPHRSFLEFLVAEYLLRQLVEDKWSDRRVVHVAPFITPEVAGFILASGYTPVIERLREAAKRNQEHFSDELVKYLEGMV
jgi:uncharacterized protein YjbI with pentapeptide repeats